jgi:hypothetical protein
MRMIKLFYLLSTIILLLLILGDFLDIKKKLLAAYLQVRNFIVKNRKKGI